MNENAPRNVARASKTHLSQTDDAEGDVFICGCCEAGEGYEDASGNALPLCYETPLGPPGLIT